MVSTYVINYTNFNIIDYYTLQMMKCIYYIKDQSGCLLLYSSYLSF